MPVPVVVGVVVVAGGVAPETGLVVKLIPVDEDAVVEVPVELVVPVGFTVLVVPVVLVEELVVAGVVVEEELVVTGAVVEDELVVTGAVVEEELVVTGAVVEDELVVTGVVVDEELVVGATVEVELPVDVTAVVPVDAVVPTLVDTGAKVVLDETLVGVEVLAVDVVVVELLVESAFTV